ncbi:MAG: CBS domain-containing protein [Desulfobulbaceae bacterium]|nr:CBS domain-containing protein [Desulfobulbaceae bacterium]
MENYLRVKQAIKKKFPAIESSENLGTAIHFMAQNNVSVLVVKVEEDLIGIITVSDVMHGLANDYDLEKTKISTFMTGCSIDSKNSTTQPCIQLDEDMDVISAIKVMYEGGINHLLVTGVANKPLGVVSNLDLVKLLASK